MLKVILITIYIASIITVIFIERKNPAEAMLWVFIMVCLPYVGTLFYLVFGNTTAIKLISFTRKKRLSELGYKDTAKHIDVDEAFVSDEDGEVMRFNFAYNQSEITCYDTAEVFTSGKEHYEHLFADIASAKETIYIEFFTIHHDIVGEALVKALTERAKSGVTVYVMCDFLANLSTPAKMFRPLVKAGGKVLRLKPYLTHYRSHRKIVVIDGEISYIGGMNIGKQYANMAEKKNPWRDTQVRLTGACSKILTDYFLSDWLCAVRKNECGYYLSEIKKNGNKEDHATKNFCQFIVGGVDNTRESSKMVYLSLIRSAKEKIRIQSPYFIPDPSILDALKVAAASGVEVEIMIPGIKANFFIEPITNYYCGQLLEHGAKIYKYNGYIHAKTLTVDNELCAIGSVNMDIRSLTVDDEVCGVFYQNDFVKEYVAIFERDIENTFPYTKEKFESRTGWDRILESFFLLFSPLM